MPAWTVAVRSPGSCSSRRFMRRRPSTMPDRVGGAPTLMAVPPPHGVTGTEASLARVRTVLTSSMEPGNAAAIGVRPSRTYGESSTPVRRLEGPTTPRRASRMSSANEPLGPSALEALGEPFLFDGVRPVGDRADFDARLLRREDLAGVAEPARIERFLQTPHQLQVRLAEDERHEVRLLEPDPVLAGDRAADLGADLHDLGSRGDHARLLAGSARIVEDVRVQIPVARMEDVADAEAVRPDDRVDAIEHVRKPRPRDHAVHDHVRGRHAPVRAERGLAALPEELAFGFVLRGAHVPRAALAARRDDALELRRHARRRAVDVD